MMHCTRLEALHRHVHTDRCDGRREQDDHMAHAEHTVLFLLTLAHPHEVYQDTL